MTAYTLTADPGAFTLTGIAAGLKVGYKMTAAAGSFTLTGVNACLWLNDVQSVYSNEVTTLCQCAKIVRSDGTEVRVTTHVDNVTICDEVYSASPGVSATAHAAAEGLSVDNQEIAGLFESTNIDPADLRAGLYRGAEVWIFEADYVTPTLKPRELDHGFIGSVRMQRGIWMAEFRSLTSLLDLEIGDRYERRCSYTLGDSNCKVDLTNFTVTGSVTTTVDNQSFIDATRAEADNYFRFGQLTWTTGNNAGVRMDVKTSTALGAITLLHSMPFTIQSGDQYTMVAGCNHLLKLSGDTWGTGYTGDCRAKFDNVLNYGGFPEMLGDDILLQGPS